MKMEIFTLLLLLTGSTAASASDPAELIARIRKAWPLPERAYQLKDLPSAESASVLFANLVEHFPDSPQAGEAERALKTMGERVQALRATVLTELAPKDAATSTALKKASSAADRLRREIKARTKKAPPALRAGTCVALDYGGGESLYRVVVVKVEKIEPGAAFGRLVYRSRPGDAEADNDLWADVLEHGKAWEVPNEVFAGGITVPCSRGEDLRSRFAAARKLGRSAAPLRTYLEQMKRIDLFVHLKEIHDAKKKL